MPTNSDKPSEGFHIADGAEVKRGHVHHIARDQLLPRIALRNQIAVETIPTYFYYFQALRGGRRCSCFDIHVSPSDACTACFGTGFVGGYQKYGAHTEVVDVTHPNITTTNVVPDYSKDTAPKRFTLIDGARHGAIETRVQIGSNTGRVDRLIASFFVQAGNSLSAWMKSPADQEYVVLNYDNLQARLGNPYVDIRVEFDRSSPENESPYLDSIYLRWGTLKDQLITVNIPRSEKSSMMEELGIFDNWDIQNFWLDNTIKSVTTDDFMISESGNTRLKIVGKKEMAPQGFLTSWDIQVRLVQPHEPYADVPL